MTTKCKIEKEFAILNLYIISPKYVKVGQATDRWFIYQIASELESESITLEEARNKIKAKGQWVFSSI